MTNKEHRISCDSIIISMALILLMLMTSCSDNDDPIPAAVRPQIVFLFTLDGLGDSGYSDCMLSGVQRVRMAYGDRADLFLHMPKSMEDAEEIFSDWVKRPESNIPTLFVLAGSDYTSMASNYLKETTLPANKRILIFEDYPGVVDGATSFMVSSYGASFLCGVAAARSVKGNALVVLANPEDGAIEGFHAGFKAGFEYGGRSADDIDVVYMADDWHGFVMSAEAYARMPEWSAKYDYIFPVAGGTNLGIYRYTREYPDCPLICGVDVDQTHLSANINGCVLKRIDIAVEEHLCRWLDTGELPEPAVYGLEDGYSDWLASPGFDNPLLPDYETLINVAVKNEKIYYNMH